MLDKLAAVFAGLALAVLVMWMLSVSGQAQNPSAAIKGPNQSPTATDPAMVVTWSPNSSQPANVTPHDCSGIIAAGGTAQNAIPATATLHGFTIVNLSNGDTLWMSLTGTAAASATGSYPLLPFTTTGGGSFVTPAGFGTNQAVSVVAATTSDPYSCTWW